MMSSGSFYAAFLLLSFHFCTFTRVDTKISFISPEPPKFNQLSSEDISRYEERLGNFKRRTTIDSNAPNTLRPRRQQSRGSSRRRRKLLHYLSFTLLLLILIMHYLTVTLTAFTNMRQPAADWSGFLYWSLDYSVLYNKLYRSLNTEYL